MNRQFKASAMHEKRIQEQALMPFLASGKGKGSSESGLFFKLAGLSRMSQLSNHSEKISSIPRDITALHRTI